MQGPSTYRKSGTEDVVGMTSEMGEQSSTTVSYLVVERQCSVAINLTVLDFWRKSWGLRELEPKVVCSSD